MEQLYTKSEVAGILKVTKRTLTRWEQSGKLIPYGRTAGGEVRYSESQVQAAMSGLYTQSDLEDLLK